MALINLQYCGSWISQRYDVQYDDVTHLITSGSPAGPCSGGDTPVNWGGLLYTQDVGFTRYEVRAQPSHPYAFISTLDLSCVLSIDSVNVSNASTNESNDGSIVIVVTGNGIKTFSIDGGVTFQSSNTFTGLAPGTYSIVVRNDRFGNICEDTDEATIEFDDVVCGLELGNIQTIQESGVGANDGEIIIQTVVDPIGLPVEYRLDAGAWQDSNHFTGLTDAVYNVQVRYKDYNSCSDSRNVSLEGCDIRILHVTIIHEQTKYGDDGVAFIDATSSHAPIQYSMDDGDTYQAEAEFTDLEPGVYQVRVKDAIDCEDVVTVEVFRFKAPYIEIPIVNGLRFVLDNSDPQNFDNRLLKDMSMPGVEPCIYRQKVQTDETQVIQFRSNYSINIFEIFTEAGVLVASLPVVKKSSNLNIVEVLEGALFANAGSNQTQIFFNTGMPDFFEIGQDIVVSNQASLNGEYEIKDIRAGTGEAEGYQVLIIDKVWPGGTTLQADVEVVYDAEPFEVYETSILWSGYAVGNYYAVIRGSDEQFSNYRAPSEPIASASEWPDHQKILYYNLEDAHKIVYSTGIQHFVRVYGFLDWPKPGGERVMHKDSRNRMIKLYENVTRNPELFVDETPGYLLEKLALIFGHDRIFVNAVEYQTDEDFESEYFECDALGNGKIKLTQVEFLAENTDDTGDVDSTILDVNDDLMAVEP